MIEYLLQYSVIISWALNIFFLLKFSREWWRGEPARGGALLALAAVAVPATITAFLLPPRGGYDNNHDFLCLGTTFFTSRPLVFPLFKEYSPLFTDGVVDILSGFSLQAVLWKNRLLPVLSIFIFFAGLRRLGAGLAASAGGTAFLFLNFLSVLTASTFSTTSANMLIWLLSLLALFDALAAPRLTAGGLTWILSSTVLVISARFEFLPANLMILSGILLSRPAAENKHLLKPGNLLVIIPWAGLLAVWAARVLSVGPERHLRNLLSPVRNLVYQLGELNLAVVSGAALPAASPPDVPVMTQPAGTAAVICGIFILTALAGALLGSMADKDKGKRYMAFTALLLLWIGYFSVIYGSTAFYPLHFMRHQLFFFLPFACLFALGADGFESAAMRLPGSWKKMFYPLFIVFLAAYAAINARTALGLGGELRTNDRELAFLMEARRDWEPGCLVVQPKREQADTRGDLIAKYFPVMPDCGEAQGQCLLKYVSPEHAIFTDPPPPARAQQPLSPGPDSEAWRAVSFDHAFYTTFGESSGGAGQSRREMAAPVPLTAGFYRLNDSGRDKAFLHLVAGACAFRAGDRSGAHRRFREAVKEDPSCLNCKYLLAVSEAAMGRGQAAAVLVGEIDMTHRGALTTEDRAIIQLLAGAGARDVLNVSPYYFLDELLAARRPRQEQGKEAMGVRGN